MEFYNKINLFYFIFNLEKKIHIELKKELRIREI